MLEGKTIGSEPPTSKKNNKKRRKKFKVKLMIWRTKMQARVCI
jgi:hypothetical protein